MKRPYSSSLDQKFSRHLLSLTLLSLLSLNGVAAVVNTAFVPNPDKLFEQTKFDEKQRFANKDIWFADVYPPNNPPKELARKGKEKMTFTLYGEAKDYPESNDSNVNFIPYANLDTNITLGHKSKIWVANDALSRVLAFGQKSSSPRYTPGGMAVGTYREGRASSLYIGTSQLLWNSKSGMQIGDMPTIWAQWKPTDPSSDKFDFDNEGLAVTSLGNNSYQQGHFSTQLGTYSISSPLSSGKVSYTGMFSILNGSLISNENFDQEREYAGVLNVVNGATNRINQSNGATILGGGNQVLASYDADMGAFSNLLTVNSTDDKTADYSVMTLTQQASEAIKTQSGKDILLAGFGNGVENGETLTVVGNGNAVKNSTGSYFMGDHYQVKAASQVVMLGGSTSQTELNPQSQTVTIGRDAQVTFEKGIVIGANAVNDQQGAIVLGSNAHAVALADQKNVGGWNAFTRTNSDKTDSAWRPDTVGMSIGNVSSSQSVTRQIQGIAAGFADTDLVNVAQLKQTSRTLSVNDGGNFHEGAMVAGQKVAGTLHGSQSNNLVLTPKRVTDGEYSGMTQADLSLNDKLVLGQEKLIEIDGSESQSKVVLGGQNPTITLNGEQGTLAVGGITASADKTITGLANTEWKPEEIEASRMATEGQLSNLDGRISTATQTLDGLNQTLKSTTNTLPGISSTVGNLNTDVKGKLEPDTQKVEQHQTKTARTLDEVKNQSWTITTKGSTGPYTQENIKNKDTVRLLAGDNMTLTQTDKGFVLVLSRDLKGINSVNFSNGVSLKLTDEGAMALNGQLDAEGRLATPSGAMAHTGDGLAYQTDNGRATVTLNHNLSVVGGVKDTSALTTQNNIGVIASDKGLKIRLAKHMDLGSTGSMKVGEVRVNSDGTISGLNSELTGNDSAVATEGHLARLEAMTNGADRGAAELRRQLNDLDVDMRDMGATAAAMAALKPVSFDAKKPSQVMLGAGAYRGREAVAMGLGHYINESLFVNAGLAVGRAKMANVGVTFSFGGPKKTPEMTQAQVSTALQQMSLRLDQLKSENDALDETNRQLDARNKTLSDTHQRLVKQQQRLQAMSSIIYRRLQALMAAQ